jgi:hypothetical protein
MVSAFAETIYYNDVLGALERAVPAAILDYLIGKSLPDARQSHQCLDPGSIQIDAIPVFEFTWPARPIRRCNTVILSRSTRIPIGASGTAPA